MKVLGRIKGGARERTVHSLEDATGGAVAAWRALKEEREHFGEEAPSADNASRPLTKQEVEGK